MTLKDISSTEVTCYLFSFDGTLFNQKQTQIVLILFVTLCFSTWRMR